MPNHKHKPTILIIAGGENSRFAPINTHTHKGFLSLVGKPIVQRALENLEEHGFENLVFVLAPKDYNGDGFSKFLSTYKSNLKITTILQEKANGMGEALLLAKEYLSDSFILASPYYSNLGQIAEKLYKKQLDTKANCVYSGSKTENQELYGILEFDQNDNQKVIGITEKPEKTAQSSNMKIDSIYLLDKLLLDELVKTKKTEYSLEDAITSHAKNNYCTWIENPGPIQSLKYPWHLFNLLTYTFANLKSKIDQGATIAKTAIINDSNGPVIIGENARIGDFAKISGPCYIGDNCFVGDYSFVRESSLEAGSIVGANTEIVRSILFENSSIHYGYLADSIIGHHTKIGAGLITANKRLDRKNIRVMVKQKLVDCGKNTLGIITGEHTTFGIKVSTMPGITVRANSIIQPNAIIKRNL